MFRPCQVNYMRWATLDPHVQTHLVPRYLDDPCPGKPLLTPLEPVPVPDNELRDQFTRLRVAVSLT